MKPKNPSKKLALTEALVAKFKCPPDAKVAFMWDTVQPGLGVRVLADHMRNGERAPGAKTWVVQGRVAGTGQERRITLGPVAEIWLAARTARDTDAERDEPDASKCSAREQARRMRRQMADSLDPLAVKAQAAAAKGADVEREQAQAVTLRQVADHYIANKKTRNGPLKPNTVRDINEVVDKAFATWAHRPIASITRAMCEARHAELARGGLTGDRPAPTSARGAFVILRALINWAMDKYRVGDEPLIRENPVRVLKGQMAPPKVRTTKVPMDRIGHVWEALRAVRADLSHRDATHTAADALAFMLLTGGRSDEVLGLTWDRVHLDDESGWWHLPTPKNSNPVTLPLSAPARALLAARPRRKGNDYVFQGRSGKARASAPRGPAMSAAIAAAGCHLDRHAFRRTFTTLALTVLDISLWKVRLLTNHVSTGGDVTLDNYTEKNDLRYLAPEAERIGAWIVEQGGIAAGRNVVALPDRKRA
jgi:integrase